MPFNHICRYLEGALQQSLDRSEGIRISQNSILKTAQANGLALINKQGVLSDGALQNAKKQEVNLLVMTQISVSRHSIYNDLYFATVPNKKIPIVNALNQWSTAFTSAFLTFCNRPKVQSQGIKK